MLHLRHVTLGSLLAATCLSFHSTFRFGLGLRALRAAERHGGRGQGRRDAKLTDGTVVRLVNAKAPTAPIAAQGDRPWPMVNEAKEALSKLASGAEVELRYGGTRTDRHGYALLQVYVVKGGERIWLQSELVGKGLARVYSFPDNHACVSELLAREAEARAKGRRGLGVLGLPRPCRRQCRAPRASHAQLPAGRRRGGAGRRSRDASISTSTRIGGRISPC